MVATKIRHRLFWRFLLLLVNNVWRHLKVGEVLNGSKEPPEPFEARGRDNESLHVFYGKLF